jgi:hypothetical protein
MTLARELAARVVATSFEDISEQAAQYAKIGCWTRSPLGSRARTTRQSRIARTGHRRIAGRGLWIWGTGRSGSAGRLDGASSSVDCRQRLDFD